MQNKLFSFQEKSVEFIEASLAINKGALIAHEMGLGKTIIALTWLNKHPENFPCLIVCKSALKINWMKEQVIWNGLKTFPYIVWDGNGKDIEATNFPIYIVSFDTLPILFKGNEKIFDRFKTVIIDEVQMIKSVKSKRSQALRCVCARACTNGEPKKIIALSGTPIKNHAGEYFPILNILDENNFRTNAEFERYYLGYVYDGKAWRPGGLKYPEQFNNLTKSYILRYTREEVMPDLPKIRRSFSYHDLGPSVEKAYAKELEAFMEETDKQGELKVTSETMGIMARMRHLTGIAKIEPVIEFALEFLESTDRKLVIFVHHQDVMTTLAEQLEKLSGIKPLVYSSDLDIIQRNNVIDAFKANGTRILIASTLAAGEGINLQFCSDAIIMERQWNPANEEQAEARFTRIGSEAEHVDIRYPTAIGTIDEFLCQLVEMKREVVSSTLKGQEVGAWQESSIMLALMGKLREAGRKGIKRV